MSNLTSRSPDAPHITEAADFERLIELSYTASYTQEDGRALSKEELLRLLVLANGYEMLLCVEECAQALQPFCSYDEALAYFNLVPQGLVDCPRLLSTTEAAANALAEALGPVEELWRPSAGKYDPDHWAASWLLDEKVASLPLPVFEALLRSEKLQLKSENYAFSLALWWTYNQPAPAEVLQLLFNRLLKSLHYFAMSPAFLASIAHLGSVSDSGLLPSIMTCSMWWREPPGSSYVYLPRSRVPRSSRGKYELTLKTQITTAAIEGLRKPMDTTHVALGMVHGYPCSFRLTRESLATYTLFLVSPFLTSSKGKVESALGSGDNHVDDNGRGLSFKILDGVVGSIDRSIVTIAQGQHRTNMGGSSLHLTLWADDLISNEEGGVSISLRLQIQQHEHA
jgi:hypothetical protein